MNFRELRHRVTIQKQSTVSDGQGGRDITWVDDFTTWAKIKPKTGGSLELYGERPQNTVTHTVTLRYRPGITPKNRIKYKTRFFEIIEPIDRMEAEKMLVLICEEVSQV
jgi:SPP1 family predicted phage head-tail adaptor